MFFLLLFFQIFREIKGPLRPAVIRMCWTRLVREQQHRHCVVSGNPFATVYMPVQSSGFPPSLQHTHTHTHTGKFPFLCAVPLSLSQSLPWRPWGRCGLLFPFLFHSLDRRMQFAEKQVHQITSMTSGSVMRGIRIWQWSDEFNVIGLVRGWK